MASIIAFSLLSVKWMFAPAAFVAPALLILVMQKLKPLRALLAALAVLYVATLIGSYNVMPFPWFVFIIISLFVALKLAIPFFLYRLSVPRLKGWMLSLAFPAIFVSYDYLNSFDGSGTWGSIAYTQVNNLPLMQLSSVTGLWGITFIIAWSASLLARAVVTWENGFRLKREAALYLSVYLLTVLFGSWRMNTLWQKKQEEVRVAGISGQNLEPLFTAYEAVFGNRLEVDPDRLTQTSPELTELNKGFVQFIENPEDPKFAGTHRQLEQYHDSLLAIAATEATAGAKIITFSEALFITTKQREEVLIAKGRKLAETHGVYLLLSMASILPGKVEMGSRYLENKALLINPAGEVEVTFLKNIPVPLVEASLPGNGEVPVIATPYGNIAISICYDADFPRLIRQASSREADILLLPSGDWQEISPYHGLMASVRAIENGFSLVRTASGATSIATDPRGNIISTQKFHSSRPNVMVAHVAVAGVKTIYRAVGDSFALACIGMAGFLLAAAFVRKK